MGNPFIEKAERKRAGREQAQRIARRNHEELAKLFNRFTDADDPATRERIRLRVEEARKVAEDA